MGSADLDAHARTDSCKNLHHGATLGKRHLPLQFADPGVCQQPLAQGLEERMRVLPIEVIGIHRRQKGRRQAAGFASVGLREK